MSVVVTAAAVVWTLAPTGTFPSFAQRREDMSVVLPSAASAAPTTGAAQTGTGDRPTPGATSPSATRATEPAAVESDEPEDSDAGDDERPAPPAGREPTEEATPTDEAAPPDEEDSPIDPEPVDPPEIPDPEPVVRTLSTRGGSVVASCDSDGSAEIIDADPNGRFKIRDIARGPSSRVGVTFRLALYTERMSVTCDDGEPRGTVDKSFR